MPTYGIFTVQKMGNYLQLYYYLMILKKEVNVKKVVLLFLLSGVSMHADTFMMPKAPETTQQFHEIITGHDQGIVDLFNGLSLQERTFIALMYQAMLPGHKIFIDQVHRHGLEIMHLFNELCTHKNRLAQRVDVAFPYQQFMHEVEIFLTYLIANHGQYFLKEHEHAKRTPARLGLTTLTPANVVIALTAIGIDNAQERITLLEQFIFNAEFGHTLMVAGHPEQSAVNIITRNVQELYSLAGPYKAELTLIIERLERAYEYAKKFPLYFDAPLVESLRYLIEFFKTGDQHIFNKHSIAWLTSTSPVNYLLGFIESYNDPLEQICYFAGDITIKHPSADLATLVAEFPAMERRLPVNSAFIRDGLGTTAKLPNAAVLAKVNAVGELGPADITAAYCLPNDQEIKALYGSKQNIYYRSSNLASRINPTLTRQLFYLQDRSQWFEQHDPAMSIMSDLWNLQVILHETLGHGSGKLAQHTFKEGENLTIEGITYNIGDTIAVTPKNLKEFLVGYSATIEELRAEILALYFCVHDLAIFLNKGYLSKWVQLLTKDELKEWMIFEMSNHLLSRLLSQSKDATSVSGAHAQANTTLTNFLISRNIIKIAQEKITVEAKEYTVLGVALLATIQEAEEAIADLVRIVQTIVSTGDGLAAKELVETYGTKLNAEYRDIMRTNQEAVVGNILMQAFIFPHFTIEQDKETGDYVGGVHWPQTLIEAAQYWGI